MQPEVETSGTKEEDAHDVKARLFPQDIFWLDDDHCAQKWLAETADSHLLCVKNWRRYFMSFTSRKHSNTIC